VNTHSGSATTRDEKGPERGIRCDIGSAAWAKETVVKVVNPNPIVNMVRALAGHNEE
jgi:hypothetical protein